MVALKDQRNSAMAKQADGNISVTALAQVRILATLPEEALAKLAERCSWSRHAGAKYQYLFTLAPHHQICSLACCFLRA